MKMLKCFQFLAVGLAMLALAGCFGLEPSASSPPEPSASPPGATPSASSAANKPYRTYINTVTCENMIKSLEAKEGQERLLLAVGAFMTGSNYAKGRDVNIDLKTLAIMTENYCRQNPRHGLSDALVAVDKSLERAQVQQQHQVAPVTNAPASAPIAVPSVAPAPKAAAPPAAALPAASPGAAKAPALAPPKPAAAISPTPAPAAKSGASSAAMPKASAGGTHLVQVISTNIEADANRLITALQGDKFPAFLERASLGDKGIWYRVVVGPYDDQAAAEKVAALLRERKFQAMVRLR